MNKQDLDYRTKAISFCHRAAVATKTLVNGKSLAVPFNSLLTPGGTAIKKEYTVTFPSYCSECDKPCQLIRVTQTDTGVVEW